MKYYYLLNGKIMWSYEKMPVNDYVYKSDYKLTIDYWMLNSLQQCEISESELEEIYRYLLTKYGIDSDELLNPTPIEVTDIVEERDTMTLEGERNFITKPMIHFKPKQVGEIFKNQK